MFAALEAFVLNLVHTLPLELFVTVGSFIEEVIPPIPSPGIMVIAGSFAAVQAYSLHGLIVLVLLASLGKTAGAFVVYSVTKRAQHLFLENLGKMVNITHADIKHFGRHFTGGFRDYVSLTFLRSVPIVPSIVLSFGSGVLELPVRVFLVGTFLGTIVRDSFYLFVGFKGIDVLHAFVQKTTHIESVLVFSALAVCGVLFAYFTYRKFRKRK